MNVETQMDRAGNLIDVLTARTLSANGAEFDFGFGDEGRGDDINPVLVSRSFDSHYKSTIGKDFGAKCKCAPY